jgi:predicted Rossmann fold nucleotide-binding protein DprA/Smf involved in DNA uptake
MLCEILTFKTSHYRNLFVAALSAAVFVAHASSGSKTEAFCKEILSWQKPIYTFAVITTITLSKWAHVR